MDEDYLKEKISYLKTNIGDLRISINHLASETLIFTNNSSLIEKSVENLLAQSQSLNQNIHSLKSIHNPLTEKLELLSAYDQSLSKKVIAHDAKEKTLVDSIMVYKNLSTEALLSYQKFTVKNITSFSKKNASIIISNSGKNPHIKLIIRKKTIHLPDSHHCTITRHLTKPFRFFIKIESWSKEFYSKNAEKIIKMFTLAMKASSEKQNN